jgi:hypothetical protein
VRDRFRTGDIILFHKSSRAGLLDSVERDVLSPLLFGSSEFRHSGVIIRRGSELSVLECTEEHHSGWEHAHYPTGGRGLRIVPLEPLLAAYDRDNQDPHYGVRFTSRDIDVSDVDRAVARYGPIEYLRSHVALPFLAARYVLPRPLRERAGRARPLEMMCSELVHSVLSACGALRQYPSKMFVPYAIESDAAFGTFAITPFSDVVRFSNAE